MTKYLKAHFFRAIFQCHFTFINFSFEKLQTKVEGQNFGFKKFSPSVFVILKRNYEVVLPQDEAKPKYFELLDFFLINTKLICEQFDERKTF